MRGHKYIVVIVTCGHKINAAIALYIHIYTEIQKYRYLYIYTESSDYRSHELRCKVRHVQMRVPAQ